MSQERYEIGLKVRKEVVGEEYVNKAFDSADSFNREFQDFITEYCWGTVWGDADLTGEVRGFDGRPYAGREVSFWSWEASIRLTAWTDDAGEFRITGVPRGRGRVSVEAAHHNVTALFGAKADEDPVEILERSQDVEIIEGEPTHVVLDLPFSRSSP